MARTVSHKMNRLKQRGLRYLSRIARAAPEWYVEFNDPEFPELYKPSHETGSYTHLTLPTICSV